MPSNRHNLTRPHLTEPHLTLDEQSFQNLLSAAFTIQEHNERRKHGGQAQAESETRRDSGTNTVCTHCGAPKPSEEARCSSCHLDEFRPGERLQRNWASMWLMSQERGLWPERSAEFREATRKDVPTREAERRLLAHAPDSANSGLLALPVAKEIANHTANQPKTARAQTKTEPIRDQVFDPLPLDKAAAKSQWSTETSRDITSRDSIRIREDLTREDAELAVQPFHLSANEDSSSADPSADPMIGARFDETPEATTEPAADTSEAVTVSFLHRLAGLRVTLRFHRADVYLGAAVCVATLALLWPAATSPRQPTLGPWERALITLGIAEAPVAPVVHLQGDPAIEVWVDPHTALYYCPGEDQYGKTTDGRFSSQREAQMDRFEPAGRAACE